MGGGRPPNGLERDWLLPLTVAADSGERKLRIAGVDLGQSHDYAAVAVLEKRGYLKHFRGPHYPKFPCLKLSRWGRGTDYCKVTDDLAQLDVDFLCVEYNGVGRPVVDMLLRACTKFKSKARVIKVLHASSHAAQAIRTEYNGAGAKDKTYIVPKSSMVSSIEICLQQQRLLLPDALGDGRRLLEQEMELYRTQRTSGARARPSVSYGNQAGADNHDDLVVCVAQGMPVLTERGEVPIEKVTTADRVWTRQGWKRVLAAQQTGVRETIFVAGNRFHLECTEDHLVALPSDVWIEAGKLLPGMRVLTFPERNALPVEPASVYQVNNTGHSLPVYDLTVEDCHEFVAGGVLVHNCLGIACWWALGKGVRTVEDALRW